MGNYFLFRARSYGLWPKLNLKMEQKFYQVEVQMFAMQMVHMEVLAKKLERCIKMLRNSGFSREAAAVEIEMDGVQARGPDA